MKDAKRLNQLWRKGDRAKVIKALTGGGKLNVRLLGLMLDVNNQAAVKAMMLAVMACHADA